MAHVKADFLVLAALFDEIRPLLILSQARPVGGSASRRCVWHGQIGGRSLLLSWFGVGRRSAEAALSWIPSLTVDEPPIVLIGLAGALDPDLGVGETIRARSILVDDCRCEPPWPSALPAPAASATEATLVTTDHIVASAEQKRQLWRLSGSPPSAAVDMESGYLASGLGARPLLVLRNISDSAEESLPPYFDRCRNAEGGLSRRRIAAETLVRPWFLPQLLRLAERLRRGARELATVVEELLV